MAKIKELKTKEVAPNYRYDVVADTRTRKTTRDEDKIFEMKVNGC